MKKLKIEKGQSLLEVVFTLAIVTLIITGVVIASTVSVKNVSYSRDNSLANTYVDEANEWLRGQRDASWTTFISRFSGTNTYCFVAMDWSRAAACGASDYISNTNNVFKRSATFSCSNAYYSGGVFYNISSACTAATVNDVQAIITVSWSDSNGAHNITTTNDLTNWRK